MQRHLGLPDKYIYVLASLGAPFLWDKVRYILDKRTVQELSRGVAESKEVYPSTSLAAIMAAAPSARAIVFLPETVSLPPKYSLNTFRRYGGRTLDEVIGETGVEQAYTEAMKHLRGAAEKYIEENVASTVREYTGIRPRVTLYLVPNTGRYFDTQKRLYRWMIERRGQGEYIDITSLYAALVTMYTLYEMLRDGVLRPGNNIVVVADITHGINYMPLMLHEAAETIAYTAAAATGNTVEMITLHSDPHSKDVEELEIHAAEKTETRPREATMQLIYMLARGPTGRQKASGRVENEVLLALGDKEERGHISRGLSDTRKKVAAGLRGKGRVDAGHYAAAIFYNLPLALLQVAHMDSDTEEILREAMDALGAVVDIYTGYRYGPKLGCSEKGCTIRYMVAARRDAAAAVAAMIGLRVYGKNLYSKNQVQPPPLPGKENIICAPLDTLNKILKEHFTGPINLVSKHEISILLRAAAGEKISTGNPLADEIRAMLEEKEEYREITGRSGGGGECAIDRRNFVAHAGLSTDAVGYIVMRPGTPSICYRRECVGADNRSPLLNILRDLFREIAAGG